MMAGRLSTNPFYEILDERFRRIVARYSPPSFLTEYQHMEPLPTCPTADDPIHRHNPVSHSPSPPPELCNGEGLKEFVVPAKLMGEDDSEIRLVATRGKVRYYLTNDDTVIAKGIPSLEPYKEVGCSRCDLAESWEGPAQGWRNPSGQHSFHFGAGFFGRNGVQGGDVDSRGVCRGCCRIPNASAYAPNWAQGVGCGGRRVVGDASVLEEEGTDGAVDSVPNVC